MQGTLGSVGLNRSVCHGRRELNGPGACQQHTPIQPRYLTLAEVTVCRVHPPKTLACHIESVEPAHFRPILIALADHEAYLSTTRVDVADSRTSGREERRLPAVSLEFCPHGTGVPVGSSGALLD